MPSEALSVSEPMPETSVSADPSQIVFNAGQDNIADALKCLRERGYAIIRGAFDPDSFDKVEKRIEELLAAPSLAGNLGYFKGDHPKKVITPTLIGWPVYDLLVNPLIVEISEKYLEHDCILAEANVKADRGVGYMYFPLHADFSDGWRKAKHLPVMIQAEEMKKPLGVGGAIYLHDTSEGAFSYCEGSHTLGAPHGPNLDAYPEAEKQEILKSWKRLDGLRGDIVLFDDRGFHGPAHPSNADRTVILVDYYRTDVFQNKQVTPMPIWSTDIGKLTNKQLTVMGAYSDFMLSPSEYKWNGRIKRARVFPLIKFLIDNAFVTTHIKNKIKSYLRR